MNQPVQDRHRFFLATTKDSHAAALLCVAEQVQFLVRMLANVDAAVERVEVATKPTEIVVDVPPIPAVNLTVPDAAAADFIKKNYMA